MPISVATRSSVTVFEAFGASVPSAHVTLPPETFPPSLLFRSLAFVGSVSTRTVSLATASPVFDTVMV